MPLAIGYVLRGESDFAGENVLIAAAPPSPPARRAQGRAVLAKTVEPAPPAPFLSTDAVPDLWTGRPLIIGAMTETPGGTATQLHTIARVRAYSWIAFEKREG